METPAKPAAQSPSIRRTLMGAACLGLQPLLLNALSVPVLGYIIHRMGAEQYAYWATSTALLAVFSLIANLGLRSPYVRAIAADPASAADALPLQLGLRLALTLPAGALVIALCFALHYPPPVINCVLIAIIGLVLTTAATTLSDTLQAFHRTKTIAAINLASGLLLTGASLLAAWWNASPEWIAAAYLLGPLSSALLLSRSVTRHICPISIRWSTPRSTRLLKDSRHFAAQQLLIMGSNHAEGLLSPRLLGMLPFGHFAAGATISNRLAVLPDALCAAAYPSMVQACNRSRRSGGVVVLRYLLIALLGGAFAALLATLIARPLGEILLPQHAEIFATVVRITAWSLPLLGLEFVLGYGINAAGREALQARLALPAAALTLATSIALVLAMGIEGACWSMVARPAIRAAILAPAAFMTFWAADPLVTTPAAEQTHTRLRKAG